MFYHIWYWRLRSESFKCYIQFNIISHVVRMSFICTHMSLVYHSYNLVCHPYVTRMSSVCHSYVLVCHSYVTRMYSYVIRMSLVCTRMSSVCHSYVLVCHPYVTRMLSYVIRMSLVCTRLSIVCTCMSSIYHSSVALPWTVLHFEYKILLAF